MLLLVLRKLLVLTVESSSRVWRVRECFDLHSERERDRTGPTCRSVPVTGFIRHLPHIISRRRYMCKGVMEGGRVSVRTSQLQRVMLEPETGHAARRRACAAWRASVPNPNMQYCNRE